MHRLRTIHVLDMPAGDPLGANGLCKAVLELALAQGRAADVHIVARGTWPDDRPASAMVTIHAGGLVDCVRTLRALARDNAVVHVHSVWSWLVMAPLLVPPAKSCRFVLSPHGVFAPEALRRSAIKKGLFRPLLRLALCKYHQLHSTSHKEAAELENLAASAQIVIVPNAVSEPLPAFARPRRQKIVGCLGRIHPIKGTLDLVRAWAEIEQDHPGWELSIVGAAPDRAYLREIEAAVAGSRSVRLSPAIDPGAAWRFLAGCELVVVPSLSENFCYVVAEAYLVGTAVAMTDRVPWPQIGESAMGWRGPAGVEGVKRSLRAALAADSKERRRRAGRGRRFVRAACGPELVGGRSLDAYASIPPLRRHRTAAAEPVPSLR